jgi:hypothetical protein
VATTVNSLDTLDLIAIAVLKKNVDVSTGTDSVLSRYLGKAIEEESRVFLQQAGSEFARLAPEQRAVIATSSTTEARQLVKRATDLMTEAAASQMVVPPPSRPAANVIPLASRVYGNAADRKLRLWADDLQRRTSERFGTPHPGGREPGRR